MLPKIAHKLDPDKIVCVRARAVTKEVQCGSLLPHNPLSEGPAITESLISHGLE